MLLFRDILFWKSPKQANVIFRVFKKPDFSKKSGFSENFMPENLWNLTYHIR